jgi:hypothetical protein
MTDDSFSQKPKYVASIQTDINAVVSDGLNFHFSVPLSLRDVIPAADVYKRSTIIPNKSALGFSEFRRAIK